MTSRLISLWSVIAVSLTLVASSSHSAEEPGALTLTGPAFLVPGHSNELQYNLATKSPLTGRLSVFQISSDGVMDQKALVTQPVRLTPGKPGRIRLDARGLPAVTADYLLRLTAGKLTGECRSQVKAWDLIDCFVDPVTEEEKREINRVLNDVPEGYNPDWDPMVDDEAEPGPDPYPYSSGIDPSTVTAKYVAAKVWYWDQKEQDAQRLYITDAVPSYRISAEDWQHVWGFSPDDKKSHDDQGAALFSLNGVFFSTNPGQFLMVKMSVAENGALDNAGNSFDRDQKTPERDGTILRRMTIDGQGNVSGHWLTAVPHKDASAYKYIAPPETKKLTRFDKFYPIYRDHIAEIWKEHQDREAERYQEQLEELRQAEQALIGHEDEWLAKLRSGKLTFEGESPANRVCLVSSDASERIFSQLMQEKFVSLQAILTHIESGAELLSPAWIGFVRDAMASSEPQSSDWKRCAELLYRAGVDEEACRPVVEAQALAGNSVALYRLFFRLDGSTGSLVVRHSPANDSLLEKLGGKASKPGIRTVCAAYASACGKTVLAESIGAELCDLKYIGAKAGDDGSAPPSQEDSELFHARCGGLYPGILTTLFYQVRTEKAFRIIIERSDADRAIRFSTGQVSKEWQRLRGYYLAESELQLADGLIYELKRIGKEQGIEK